MKRRLAKAWWWAVDWARYLSGRETRDQAWIDGSRDSDQGWQELVDDKDVYIEQQSTLIAALDEFIWNQGVGPNLPPDLEHELRYYR